MRKENLLIKEILNLGIRHQQKGNFEEAKKKLSGNIKD